MSTRRLGVARATVGPRVRGSGYAQTVLANNPLGYWRLGEASGTTMGDASGNGRSGTYVASPSLGTTGLVTGDTDTAATFTAASSQYGEVTAASWMNSLSAITLVAWIKPSATTAVGVVSRDLTGANGPWRLRLSGNVFQFLLWHPSLTVLSTTGTLTAGTRYHVAATYDGATMKTYLNGSPDGSSAQTGALNASDNPNLRIGAYGSAGEYFSGVIDEVAFYGTALSAAAISADYAAGV